MIMWFRVELYICTKISLFTQGKENGKGGGGGGGGEK